jgi:hypothetical protein
MSVPMNTTMPVFRNGEGSLPPNAPLHDTSILNPEEQLTDWPSTLSHKNSIREASPSFDLTTNPMENPTLESPLPRAAKPLRQSTHRKSPRDVDALEEHYTDIPQGNVRRGSKAANGKRKMEALPHQYHSKHNLSNSRSAYLRKLPPVRDLSAALLVSGANFLKNL